MPITLSRAGDSAIYKRAWTISQGADTPSVNAVRPYTRADPADPDSARTYTDWSTYTGRAQIRDEVGGTVLLDMTTEGTDARVELTADGWVRLIVPSTVTEAEAWNAIDKGVYDLELIDASGSVTRFMEGNVTVKHDVTREVTP